jgi:hypothetical protein
VAGDDEISRHLTKLLQAADEAVTASEVRVPGVEADPVPAARGGIRLRKRSL